MQFAICGWLWSIHRGLKDVQALSDSLRLGKAPEQPTVIPRGPPQPWFAPPSFAPPSFAPPSIDFGTLDPKADDRMKLLSLSKIDSLFWQLRSDIKPEKNLPNIILIVNEALSAKYLGFLGLSKVMTPNMDAFAANSLVFQHAIAQGSWTAPSMRSILTGLYPNQLGFFEEGVNPAQDALSARLPLSIVTLAEVLRNKGYFCAALIGANFRFFEITLRGFSYVDRFFSSDLDPYAAINTAMSLIERGLDQPYFLLLHLYPPHEPYAPRNPPKYPDGLPSLTEAQQNSVRRGFASGDPNISRTAQINYQRQVEELDSQYGRLFKFLESSRAPYFNPQKDILIFTADHGEEFEHENGYVRHGLSLYQEIIGVPLVFRLPGISPKTITEYVENGSILPTLLDYLEIKDPRPATLVAPRSLLPMMTQDTKAIKQTAPSFAFSEAILRLLEVPGARELKSIVRSDGKKIIFDTQTKKSKLFDLIKDPTEDRDLALDKASTKLIDELYREIEKRTNPTADYPVLPGKFLDHVVPTGTGIDSPKTGGP